MRGNVFRLCIFFLFVIQGFCFGAESLCITEPQQVFISAVVTTPTESESITLKNNSGIAVDLSGWTLGDKNDPAAYSIPANTILQHTQTITFSHTTLGFQINDAAEIIYLKHGEEVVDVWGK